MANAETFPHPVYARYVLEPQFHESKARLFDHMIAANEAHTVMLHECGILEAAGAAKLLRALQQVKFEGVDSFVYEPHVEDLFFAVEGRLIEISGADTGGNLQIARSRNDLAAGISRLMMRERLLSASERILDLRRALIDVAAQHTESLMSGITHTQPAQPTTLAHYILGVIAPLERDFTRLQHALFHTNQSSFGVAAFTTTSFPIDRGQVASLLGLPIVLENGYDAVGAGDHIMESATAMTNAVGSLSRFVNDLLVFSRATENLIQIDDAFIQISSIMPQKRNPVVLEHIRVRVGWVYGEANAVQTMIHNAAFGDTNDVEDPMFISLNRAFDGFEAVTSLLTAVIQSATFNTELMSERAYSGHMTTTALADALVQRHGIAFRSAHKLVSNVVNRSIADDRSIDSKMVRAASNDVFETPLDVTSEFVELALDPWEFVKARTVYGGCAPETTSAAIQRCYQGLNNDLSVVAALKESILSADTRRAQSVAGIISRWPS